MPEFDPKPDLAFCTTAELIGELKARSSILAVGMLAQSGEYITQYHGNHHSVRGLVGNMNDWVKLSSIEWMRSLALKHQPPTEET